MQMTKLDPNSDPDQPNHPERPPGQQQGLGRGPASREGEHAASQSGDPAAAAAAASPAPTHPAAEEEAEGA